MTVYNTPTTLDEEFEKALRDQMDADPSGMKQSQHIVMEVNDGEGGSESKSEVDEGTRRQMERVLPRKQRVTLSTERKQQRKLKQMPMIGGEYGMYACDIPVCVKLWQSRGRDSVKPRWAVDALVRFRDQGVCQVCGDECGRHAEVVRRRPPIEGGEFNEYNCILVCEPCAQVWPKKNFYTSQLEEFDMYRQYMYVLKKRAFGKKGAIPLSSKGMIRYRDTMHEMDSSQMRMERELEAMKRTVGREIVRKRMTEQEYWDMLKGLGKKPDTQSSDNEVNEWDE